MIISAFVICLTALTIAYVTHNHSYRLSGVVTIPFFIIYSMYKWESIPVLLGSTLLALLTLWILEKHTLRYGRDLFISSVVAGSSLPVVFALLTDISLNLAFIGSVIPGISAYNFYKLKFDLRKNDTIISILMILSIISVTSIFMIVFGPRYVSFATEPILLSNQSDTANFLNVAFPINPVPNPSRIAIVIYLMTGVLGGELIRRTYDLRTGLVIMSLLALFFFQSQISLPLFILFSSLSYITSYIINRSTMIYGRVLLGLSVSFCSFIGGILSLFVNINPPLQGLITIIIGSVYGYNLFITHPKQRKTNLFISASMFFLTVPIGAFLDVPVLEAHTIPVSGVYLILYVVIGVLTLGIGHYLSDYRAYRKIVGDLNE